VPPTPEEAMFLPFTDRVREVMKLAEQETRRLNHEYVGTEHILLGLMKAQPGPGVTVLRNLGVEPDRASKVVENITPPGELVGGEPLPLTPRTKALIQYGCQEAYDLNHNYVGTSIWYWAHCGTKKASRARFLGESSASVWMRLGKKY
jgi:ATP-dependent Clp protease ATP-binding subunit ClpC